MQQEMNVATRVRGGRPIEYRTFSRERKKNFVREFLVSNMPASQFAAKNGLKANSMRNWVRKYGGRVRVAQEVAVAISPRADKSRDTLILIKTLIDSLLEG